jgi:hypothetical protein
VKPADGAEEAVVCEFDEITAHHWLRTSAGWTQSGRANDEACYDDRVALTSTVSSSIGRTTACGIPVKANV